MSKLTSCQACGKPFHRIRFKAGACVICHKIICQYCARGSELGRVCSQECRDKAYTTYQNTARKYQEVT